MNEKTKIIITIAVALSPILAVYIILPGITLATIVLFLCVMLIVFDQSAKISNDEFGFSFIVFFLSFLEGLVYLALDEEWFNWTLFTHNLFSISCILVPFCFLKNCMDLKIFSKTIFVVGAIASCILIWQKISLFFWGTFQKNVFLPWFKLSRNLDFFSLYRPSAFFTEPAHFATYMIPAFYLSLIYKKKLLGTLFGFAILCSGSSTGFIFLGLILLFYIQEKGGGSMLKVIKYFVLFSFIIICFFCFFPELFISNFDKMKLNFQGNSDIRLWGPLVYLFYFDCLKHLIGISLNQLSDFMMFQGIRVPNYANGIIYIYLSYGIGGLISFVLYFLRKLRGMQASKVFGIIFLGIMCSDQIIFNVHFLYLMTFVILTDSFFYLNPSSKCMEK